MPDVPPRRTPSVERALNGRYARTAYLLGMIPNPPWERAIDNDNSDSSRSVSPQATQDQPPVRVPSAAPVPPRPMPREVEPNQQQQPPRHAPMYHPPPYPPPFYHHPQAHPPPHPVYPMPPVIGAQHAIQGPPPPLPYPFQYHPRPQVPPEQQYAYYPQPQYLPVGGGWDYQQPHAQAPGIQLRPHRPQHAQRDPPSHQQVPDAHSIDVSIPRNTSVVGGVVSRITVRFPTNIPFDDFFARVCANMDLDPALAALGYKFPGDRVRDPAHRLSNADELRQAMDRGTGMIRRARTRRIYMEIHNLHPAQAANGTRGRRSGASAPDTSSSSDEHVVSYLTQLRELKGHLSCAKHNGRFCWVHPDTGEHISLDLWKVTLWAKKWLLNEASLHQPPEDLHLNDSTRKRARRTNAAGSSPPAIPPIHIHLSNGSSGAQSGMSSTASSSRASASQPSYSTTAISSSRTEQAQPRELSISPDDYALDSRVVVEDFETPELIPYPSVRRLLHDLNETMPIFDLPSYESNFLGVGLAYIDSVTYVDREFLVEYIGVPVDAVDLLLEHAHALKRRAEKGKGKAPVIEIDSE